MAGNREETEPHWIATPVATTLLKRKYALVILVFLRDKNVANTTGVIEGVGGHPEAVTKTLDALHHLGLLSITTQSQGHHANLISLTPKGMEMMETPVYRWAQFLSKRGKVP